MIMANISYHISHSTQQYNTIMPVLYLKIPKIFVLTSYIDTYYFTYVPFFYGVVVVKQKLIFFMFGIGFSTRLLYFFSILLM